MERAAATRPLLNRVIEAGVVTLAYSGRLVQTAAALAAWADRDWAAAEVHLAQAAADAGAAGDEVQGTDLQRFKAMMLLDRAQAGDFVAARELLRCRRRLPHHRNDAPRGPG